MINFPIQRSDLEFIGDGTERLCYIYIQDPSICIKIPRSKTHLKQHRHDQGLYKKLESRIDRWDHIAKYMGTIETPNGEGLAFETIRDFDGNVSKSLLYFLYNDQEAIDDVMLTSLKKLEIFIKKYRIILKDPSPSNLLYKRESKNGGGFVLIDGIGSLYPNNFFFNLYVNRKVSRQWSKLLVRMKKELKNTAILEKMETIWPFLK